MDFERRTITRAHVRQSAKGLFEVKVGLQPFTPDTFMFQDFQFLHQYF